MQVKTALLIILLCWVSSSRAAVPSAVLFTDNFNRPNNTDIDASSDGMAGLLSPMTYVEIGDDVIYPQQSGTGNPYPELTRIESNRLYMAAGTNATTMYLGHNFVDNEILAADGMRIGLTIIQDLGPQTTAQFFAGFGVGNTLQECQTTWFDHNGTGFRGQVNLTPAQAGTSDLWIGWSPANGGTIQVFKNGPTAAGGENYNLLTGVALTGSDRLEMELYFEDFNDGSPVNAFILWNGVIIGTEAFTWDVDGKLENYIGINARQTAGFIVDDLAIEAIYNGRAHNPFPADGTADIPVGAVTLGWDKGRDASGAPNPLITKHYLYVTDEVVNGEPNFAASSAEFYEINDVVDPVTRQITIDYDQTIYWRVDESVLVNAIASGPNDPNTIAGVIWQFDALKSVPTITAHPVHTAAFSSESASFSVSASSLTEVNYVWYKSLDNANNTPLDDLIVGGNAATHTIDPVGLSDEGYYYCKVTNTGTGETGAQYSNPAYLTVKRRVLYWDFEDNFLDKSGEGNHGQADLTAPTFESNIPGAVGTKSAGFNGVNQRLTFDLNPDKIFHAGFTLTMWIRPAVLNPGNNVAMFNNNNGGDYDFQIDFNAAGALRYQGTNNQPFMTQPVTDWIHVAVVCNGTTTTIYHDLEGNEAVVSNGADIVFGQFQIGCNRAGDTFYNGLIDDVQVWNYPRTYEEMASAADDAADYYDVMQKPACQSRPPMDMNGDCKVNLSDLIGLANSWLNCGLYPMEECNN